MPEAETPDAGRDTIFAPATGEGRTAVAIIRVSGPDAHRAVLELTGAPLPCWRELAIRALTGPASEILDRALVAVFPEGGSYTGEAAAEFHCHGGRAVVNGVLERLGTLPGLRLAEPGEFTLRALMAGRMDLSEVEGLRDLIDAETSGQRRQALRVHSGAVSRLADDWRDSLLRARALLEVMIDFADEEVPDDLGGQVEELLARVIAGMEVELRSAGPADRMRHGFEVAIVGRPNAGKSSLLNMIAGRDAAIVSEVAGTTRDVVEVRVDLDGLPVTFLDMAGLREASDAVEAIGVKRARLRAGSADLRLLLNAVDVGPCDDGTLRQKDDIVVWAKSDLGSGEGEISISVTRPETIGALLDLVRDRLRPRVDGASVLVTARQQKAVEDACCALKSCEGQVRAGNTELVAEGVRVATAALDRLVGRIGVEDVLGEIFAGFCLGK